MDIRTWMILILSIGGREVSGQAPITGTVYDKSLRPIRGVSVMGTSGAGTVTDSMGKYHIRLVAGDSIYFSYLGKSTARFAVSDLPEGQPLDMSLQVRVDTMPTVFVHPRDYRADSIENRREYDKVFNYGGPRYLPNIRLSPRGGIGGMGLDLGLLFNIKQARRMEALQKRLIEEEHDKYIDHRFTKAIVKRVTGLRPPALDSFMVQYRPSYELIQSCETDYEFYRYIKEWGQLFYRDWKQSHPE